MRARSSSSHLKNRPPTLGRGQEKRRGNWLRKAPQRKTILEWRQRRAERVEELPRERVADLTASATGNRQLKGCHPALRQIFIPLISLHIFLTPESAHDENPPFRRCLVKPFDQPMRQAVEKHRAVFAPSSDLMIALTERRRRDQGHAARRRAAPLDHPAFSSASASVWIARFAQASTWPPCGQGRPCQSVTIPPAASITAIGACTS